MKNVTASLSKCVQAASLWSLQGRSPGWAAGHGADWASWPALTNSPNIPCPGNHGNSPGTVSVPAPKATAGPEGSRCPAVPHCHEVPLGRQEGPHGEELLHLLSRGGLGPVGICWAEMNWGWFRPWTFCISPWLLPPQSSWSFGPRIFSKVQRKNLMIHIFMATKKWGALRASNSLAQ